MFSLLSCELGFAELCSSINCERRRAHAIPAGPPPTITTSAGICGRSIPSSGLRKTIMKNFCYADSEMKQLERNLPSPTAESVLLGSKTLTPGFRLLDFFNQWRYDIEQVAHDCVISDLENWCLRILIDSDDCARALHPNNVLNRTADAERQVELGRNGLSGGPDLAVHGQPSGIADRARGREISAKGIRQLLGNVDILLLFDAAADCNDDLCLRKIYR